MAPGHQVSHYRLVEKIGEGGMGVVWKAEDLVLGRSVAIKVLPADVALDEKRRGMFLDEARLASSVSDARIVQVYELGHEGDLDFIVMELVEGRPLSQILHGRPLPPEQVATLGEQVARALGRAHRKGLLHRDLKPANILVTPDGDVKVVDFGLATLFSDRVSTRGTESTTVAPGAQAQDLSRTEGPRHGGIAGTVPYMSPEHARGEPLDARSDIFSLGTVLYEMTTGRRPFTGATNTEVLQEVLKARPVSVHDLVPKDPLDLDRMIQKALAPRRSDRYQTMDDLAVDLKHLGRELESGSSPSYEGLHGAVAPARAGRKNLARAVLAAGAVGAAGLAGWVLLTPLRGAATGVGTGAVAEAAARTLLILPLEVRGQSEGADYVGLAFAEGLAINIAQAGNLMVLPVTPAAATREAGDSARHARELGAGRVLTGSLTRGKTGFLASLSLLDATENRIVWGIQRELPEDQISSLAAGLAREVASDLGGILPERYETVDNALRTSAMSTSPILSEVLGAMVRHDLPAVLAATERLVERFPDDRDAHASRVSALVEGWFKDHSREAALNEATAALRRLDPDHPQIDLALGFVESGKGMEGASVARFTRLLARSDLTPHLRGDVLYLRGWNRVLLRELEAATRDLEEAARSNPTNARVLSILSFNLALLSRVEEARNRGRQAIALSPSDPDVHGQFGMALSRLELWAEAVPILQTGCELARAQGARASYATALSQSGRMQEALAVVRDAGKLPDAGGGLYNFACFWARAGNRAEALRCLRQVLEQGWIDPLLGEDPDLASLRGDPDFKAIVTLAGSSERESR